MLAIDCEAELLTFLLMESFTIHQEWTSLNKDPSWSWSFFSSYYSPRAGAGAFRPLIFSKNCSWSLQTPDIFFPELELELKVSGKNVEANSGDDKFIF